mmetsp:Transcript_57627/g.146530  ORF Transcript_57627/g.146530 Transcript_57627/m.146530 type:complete len:371 (-) Transcript_57627:93-1205(-)
MRTIASNVDPIASIVDAEISERVGIRLTRCSTQNTSAMAAEMIAPLMGRSTRNAITGNISIPSHISFRDFVLVDLWTRRVVEGSAEELSKDIYLFKPVPLLYRTWLYHFEYLNNRMEIGGDENGMVKQALKHRCIDAPISAGRWSPVMCFIPMCVAVSFTDNSLLLLPCLFMMIAGQSLSNTMNTAPYYRFLRPATFVPRLLFYVAMILVFAFQESPGNVALLAFVIAMVAASVDLMKGDFEALRWFGLHCRYDVVKVLPSRVFACRRVGACYSEDIFGSRPKVDEVVSGFFPWEHDHVLIADIQGILMELRPMQLDDWLAIYDQNVVGSEALSFLSLDMFNNEMPTQRAIQEELDLILKAKLSMKYANR